MIAGGAVMPHRETPSFSNDEDEKQIYGHVDDTVEVDHDVADPFGNEELSEVKYRTMEWW